MTSTEYRDVLDLLALTQAEMAELLGVSIRTAHGYANGARIVVWPCIPGARATVLGQGCGVPLPQSKQPFQ